MSATPPRLTATSYALLGAVSKAGPCSPYELKRVLARYIGSLWEVPHSQIYDEAARLARSALLLEVQEGTGRRRLSYSITEAGRRELLRWMRSPSRERMELRDIGLLKVAFAAELEPAELAHVAEDHAEAWQALSHELSASMDGPGAAYAAAMAAAAVAFWQTLRDGLSVQADQLVQAVQAA